MEAVADVEDEDKNDEDDVLRQDENGAKGKERYGKAQRSRSAR